MAVHKTEQEELPTSSLLDLLIHDPKRRHTHKNRRTAQPSNRARLNQIRFDEPLELCFYRIAVQHGYIANPDYRDVTLLSIMAPEETNHTNFFPYSDII